MVDLFRFEEPEWSFGPADSPLVLRDCFEGTVDPVPFAIVERRGCDLAPVDPATDTGALRLRSFVWPFHVERHERLRAALHLARRSPATVDRSAAGDWLLEQLATPPDDEVLTVVWQSITRQYWPTEEVSAARTAIEEAAGRMSLGWVAMEYPSDTAAWPVVTLNGVGQDGARSTNEDVLGTVGDHGVPMFAGRAPDR